MLIQPSSLVRISVLLFLAAVADAQSFFSLKHAVAKPRRLTVAEIREAEQRLSDLAYWTGPVDGVFDPASRQALIAFQKVEGRTPTGRLTRVELEALRVAKRPTPMERGPQHVEVNLGSQVLFIVDASGAVSKILPVSTGSGEMFTSEDYTQRAITPTGRFRVQRKIDGWRKSPLGLLYYPVYIVGGIAIHGNPSVPVTPQSHGCIRIPMFAAKEFSEMTELGTPVIVHPGTSPES
jgi:L,D-transpeptidase-like protein/putative peptidoglycan binding protein